LIKKTRPESAKEFLEVMQFDTYLETKYGNPALPGGLSAHIERLLK